MASTIFISDTHKNNDFLNSLSKLTHEIDGTVIHGGDFLSSKLYETTNYFNEVIGKLKRKIESELAKGNLKEEDAEKIYEIKSNEIMSEYKKKEKICETEDGEEYKKINEIFGSFKNKTYGVLGNHDPDFARGILNNVHILEDRVENINGINYAGIHHASANLLRPDCNQRIKEYKKNIEELCSSADYLVSHEIPHKYYSFGGDEETKKEGKEHSEDLDELANKYSLNLFGGHIHNSKFKTDENRTVVRPYCESNEEGKGSFYVLDNKNNQIYEIENSNLIKWYESFKKEDSKLGKNEEAA